MTSPFIQGMRNAMASQAKLPVRQSLPTLAAAPVTTGTDTGKKRYNPFLTALNSDSDDFKDAYGINRPLKDPMFVGYHNDRPIFAGKRLFLLY